MAKVKKNILISVIIPVYNAEKFLKECLSCVMNQTLEDIEIICVNDGSTDNSLKVLQSLAENDERIIILDQKNLGAGVARNKGLSIARGKYLSFLDADDFFESTMLEEAYLLAEKEGLDIVCFRSDIFEENKGHYIYGEANWSIREDLLPARDIFCANDVRNEFFNIFVWWAWDKLFRRAFIVEHKLFFQDLRTTNDLYFVSMATLLAKRISVLNNVLAHHRINVGTSLEATREKSWGCFYEALKGLQIGMEKYSLYNKFKRPFINYCLEFSLWHISTLSGIAYVYLYEKLKEQWFNELDITDKKKAYFYHDYIWNEYQKVLAFDPIENLRQNEVSAIESKNYVEEANKALEKKNEELKNENNKLKLELTYIKSGYSFRMGRVLTYIPRYIRRIFTKDD